MTSRRLAVSGALWRAPAKPALAAIDASLGAWLSSLETLLAELTSRLFGLFLTVSGSLMLTRLGSSGRLLGSRFWRLLRLGARRLRLMPWLMRLGLCFGRLGRLVALRLR